MHLSKPQQVTCNLIQYLEQRSNKSWGQGFEIIIELATTAVEIAEISLDGAAGCLLAGECNTCIYVKKSTQHSALHPLSNSNDHDWPEKTRRRHKWVFMIDSNSKLATSGCCTRRCVCVHVCLNIVTQMSTPFCPQNYKSGSQREGQLSSPRCECARTHAHTLCCIYAPFTYSLPDQTKLAPLSGSDCETFGQQINKIPQPDKCRLLSVKQNQQHCSWDNLL